MMNFQAAARLSPVTPFGIARADPVAMVSVCVLLRIRGSIVWKLAFGLTAITPISHCSKTVIAV